MLLMCLCLFTNTSDIVYLLSKRSFVYLSRKKFRLNSIAKIFLYY